MPRETTSNRDFFSLRRLTKYAVGMPCVYTGSGGFDFILNCYPSRTRLGSLFKMVPFGSKRVRIQNEGKNAIMRYFLYGIPRIGAKMTRNLISAMKSSYQINCFFKMNEEQKDQRAKFQVGHSRNRFTAESFPGIKSKQNSRRICLGNKKNKKI